MGLKEITGSYVALEGVAMGLQDVWWSYMGLRGLNGVVGGYLGLHGVTGVQTG